MTLETYTGRLVCDGEGNLRAFGGEHDGRSVAFDPETESFIFIAEDAPSHNDRHGKNTIEVGVGTSGPLFDANGNRVAEGDPHHETPTPDDPHYDEHAPNKTRLVFDDDGVAATVTGHTEAYRG